VTVNRETASQYGLTAAAIGSAVRSELVGSTATEVTINNKEIDVVVRGDGSSAGNLDALRSMSVTTAYGGTVPLSSVASVDVVLAPQTINRVDQSRQITITGTTLSGNSLAASEDIQAIIDDYNMPEGYTAKIGGSSEDIEDNFGDLTLALLIAAGLVYFVLASQFESFLMPIIIMLILPVAFAGALFALPVTGRDLSMISMVALIMLAGTVVNASIILVDYIKKRRKSGEDRETAIINACPLRVRPVLMTTLTTILALVPMAIGLGDTNEMLTDMGITMISGMAISTIVTLFFTPVYYCLIDNIGRKKREQRYAEEAAAGKG
ncbi:MAG: efflux RND transporter permease subunit, partial [Oscillospiraceae bacterium]|nr:efflux RND transporter permease subunit [Oscillospiraceae bacterium]